MNEPKSGEKSSSPDATVLNPASSKPQGATNNPPTFLTMGVTAAAGHAAVSHTRPAWLAILLGSALGLLLFAATVLVLRIR